MTASLAPSIDELEVFRSELIGYCYRMLGSAHDAEDAAQEAITKAWHAAETFEGRSSTRTWLYRIATNTCLDMLRAAKRRAAPIEMGPQCPPVEASLAAVLPQGTWVTPIADERVMADYEDPAHLAQYRESIRLAFVAALQHLPPRQRAVLILHDVLRWSAAETAQLLQTTPAAVNSALQRARGRLASVPVAPTVALDAEQEALLANYVAAFEAYDLDAFVTLLHHDAIQSMPPFAMWIQGAATIKTFMGGPGAGCRGSRLLTTSANGTSAVGQYRPDPAGGHEAWALHVLDMDGGLIRQIHTFLDTGATFPAFGLPDRLD